MDALKKEFQVTKFNFLQMILITIGMYGFGTMVSTSIVLLSESTEYVSVGLILAFAGCFVCTLVAGAQLIVGFDMAVGMSVNRKRYFISSYVNNYALLLVCFITAGLLSLFDKFFAGVVVPEAEYIMNVSALGLGNFILLMVFISLTLTAMAMFVGALLHKWGMKAFWTLWVIWMVGSIGIPQFFSGREESAIGKAIQSFFARLFQMAAWQWGMLAIVLSGVLTVIAWLILRKEKVA